MPVFLAVYEKLFDILQPIETVAQRLLVWVSGYEEELDSLNVGHRRLRCGADFVVSLSR